jgi:hypothetical protein
MAWYACRRVRESVTPYSHVTHALMMEPYILERYIVSVREK